MTDIKASRGAKASHGECGGIPATRRAGTHPMRRLAHPARAGLAPGFPCPPRACNFPLRGSELPTTSFPRKRESRSPFHKIAMDARLRGNDGRKGGHPMKFAAALAALLLATLPLPAAHAAETPRLSPARTAAEANLVDVRSRVPDIREDIKYAGSDNFVGRPVDGYHAPKCLLHPPAADALARVERALRAQGYRLEIWDCYRPARAVADFVRWAHDLADTRTKAAHYPHLDKSKLLGDYIAPVSGHSRGSTLDLDLLRCDARGEHCAPLDMGTGFDYFDPRANTDTPGLSAEQRANRARLREAMERAGFKNYPMEWWHYTWQPEPTPDTIYDVPVE